MGIAKSVMQVVILFDEAIAMARDVEVMLGETLRHSLQNSVVLCYVIS
jgi:hypothetical protein